MSRRTLQQICFPVGLIVGGTLGYWLIEENYDLFDGLYMTIITLSTIGYGETHELSRPGRVFTLFLILSGVFTFAFVFSEFARQVVSGEFRALWGKQQMEQELAKRKNHIVVCGYGRVGRLVCLEFSKERVPFVIIDARAEVLVDFVVSHGIPIAGDATSDEVLRRAGIERARGLVTVMASDADNMFTTMSARLLNPKLFIVARVENAESEQKLLRAGANRVVSPYQIGGARVAQAMLRPAVMDFIELATGTEFLEVQIEETRLTPDSPLVGRSIGDCDLRASLKVIVVAIKKSSGKMIFSPEDDVSLEAGDTLIAMGSKDQLLKFDALANPQAKAMTPA
ncbi:MAG: potassium channel protein [Gemmataceae bacterium]|nr:potassium channel protein [Gemmataceae bacterium]